MRFLVGDVFDGLAILEDDSVDLVMTSPPFLALRSYLPADHPDKGKEIGSESTPADFLDRLLDVVEACDRVLAPHGSLVFELGDTYAGGGQGPDPGKYAAKADVVTIRATSGAGWPLAKSLCGIPTLFAWSLAYGRNLLRPERETEQWRIRNVVAWCRPNPPVGALGDKFRPGTSYLTVATRDPRRYFDGDSVRVPHVNPRPQETNGEKNATREAGQGHGFDRRTVNPLGSPRLDWWEIPTAQYRGAHYATFPERLVEPLIVSMCPREVCRACGRPRRPVVDVSYVDGNGATVEGDSWESAQGEGRYAHSAKPSWLQSVAEIVDWSDCGHGSFRQGVVLDPFAGSGTTLAVAQGLGRDAIGIDLDERNAELARERCGMFLEVSVLEREGVA